MFSFFILLMLRMLDVPVKSRANVCTIPEMAIPTPNPLLYVSIVIELWCSGDSRFEQVVVLLPPGQIVSLDVVHEDEGKVDTVGGVREVVASSPVQCPRPADCACVSSLQDCEDLLELTSRVEPVQSRQRRKAPLLERCKAALGRSAPEVVPDGSSVAASKTKGHTNGGADDEAVGKDGIELEHVLDTKGTIENTGGEDQHGVGADEVLLVAPGAESAVVVARNHPVEHTDENEAVDDNTNDLTAEDSTWRYLSVVTHLLTRDIVHGLSIEVLTESSHDDESLGVTDEPCSGEQLEQDVEAHGDVGGSHEKGRRDQHDGRNADDAEESPPWGRHGPDFQCDNSEGERASEDDEEPPVGDFAVL